MRIKSKSIIPIFIICIFGIIGITGMNPLFLITSCIVFISMIIYAEDIYNHFAIFFFLFSYYFFLMSSEFVQEVFGVVNTREVTAEAVYHTQITLLIGVIFLLLGYNVSFLKKSTNKIYKYDNRNTELSNIVKSTAKIIFFASYMFYLLPSLEQALYVSINSYVGYYINFKSSIPWIIPLIGDICPISFCVFLSTFPNKNESKSLFVLYLTHAAINILTGKRFYSVAAIIFVVSYALIRNNTDRNLGIRWISKKTLSIGLILVPIVCVALYTYSYTRSGRQLDTSLSFVNKFLEFFNSVGQSDKVIKYGYMYKDRIPNGHIYSFGGLIDYFRYNSLTKLITGETLVRGHNIEYALYGNGFSTILTYLVYPNRFSAGYGLGSCFLAELYQDAGYIGVAIGSLIYGILIRNTIAINKDGIVRNTLALYMYTTLIRAPRASFDVFLQEIINVKFVFFLILILLIAFRRYNSTMSYNTHEQFRRKDLK